jgi:hypothetical protein
MVTTSGGTATVNFTAAFAAPPTKVTATAQFNSGGYAQSGRVTISNVTTTGFDITVNNGSGAPYDGVTQVCWVAVA